MSTLERLLCICPIGIGNYLMVYPACALIKKYRPELSLNLLGLRNSIRDLAAGDPLWESIQIFDPTKLESGLGPRFKIISELRQQKFSSSLSLFPSNRWEYNALPFLAGIPQRFGFSYRLKRTASLSFLLNRKQSVNPALHDVHQNLSLSGLFLGRSVEGDPVRFPQLFGETELRWAEQFMGSTQPVIAVHPGSSPEHGMSAKRWPPERFGKLAEKLANLLNAQVFVFGGPDEEHIKKDVLSAMATPGRFVEPVSLRRTAALLSQCRVSLCNDSGLMHMSACAGVPTIGVFGPTDERRNGPYGIRTLVLRHDLPGFPIWTAATVGDRSTPSSIDPMASLMALTVEEAWSKIVPWLESAGLATTT